MATGSAPSASQIGSYFVQQYYRILQESPDYVHQFYTDSSTVTRVDGDIEDTTATTMLDIHSLLTALKYTSIEVSNIKCQDSLNGGILVIVSGYVKSRNFTGRRKFSQVFFLAPQEKGFFVHNDFFEYVEEEQVEQHPVPEIPETRVDSEAHTYAVQDHSYAVQDHSYAVQDHPSSDYAREEESSEYINSVTLDEDNPVDDDVHSDESETEELEAEPVAEGAPVDDSPLLESDSIAVQEDTPEPVNESAGDSSSRLTYASILRAAKGVSASQPVRRSMPPKAEPIPAGQTASLKLNPTATSSNTSESVGVKSEETQTHEEGEPTSVYVRNLPSNVTATDLEEEFKNFGRIKPNGIFIRNRKEIGICFAFVEFEDLASVHVATQASPIQLLDRQVYIEERRASSGGIPRGGGAAGRGRGRSSRGGAYPTDTRGRAGGRGSSGGFRGNGFHQ